MGWNFFEGEVKGYRRYSKALSIDVDFIRSISWLASKYLYFRIFGSLVESVVGARLLFLVVLQLMQLFIISIIDNLFFINLAQIIQVSLN